MARVYYEWRLELEESGGRKGGGEESKEGVVNNATHAQHCLVRAGEYVEEANKVCTRGPYQPFHYSYLPF